MPDALLSLSDLARILPTANGKPIPASSLWRWAVYGVRGVRLEHQLIGGRYYSSPAALAKFSDELKTARDTRRRTPATLGTRTPEARAAAIAKAEAELADSGFSRRGRR